MSDSVSSVDEDGTAHFFEAWYQTDGVRNATCILVSGIDLVVQEEVTFYEETSNQVMVR